MDLGKLLRKQVRTVLRPFLEEQGFTEFSDLAAWRNGERWIDCVQVMTLGATEFGFPRVLGWEGMHEVYANAATFSLEIGCYYTDVHLLPWTGPVPDRPRPPRGQGPRYPVCHRLLSLARSYEYANVQGTLYPSADDGSDLDRAVADTLRAVRTRGMAWLEGTHDIGAFLAQVNTHPHEDAEEEGSLELSDEDRNELTRWMASQGMEAGQPFTIFGGNGLPEFMMRLQRSANLRDHTATSSPHPYGDLLYGLLVGSGRIDEAMAAMRRDSDPAPDETRYGEMLAHGLPKRSVTTTRTRDEAYRAEIREHLSMLEADLSRSASNHRE